MWKTFYSAFYFLLFPSAFFYFELRIRISPTPGTAAPMVCSAVAGDARKPRYVRASGRIGLRQADAV
ncbi:hypothetical protein, partial [Rugamonas sp.]|uniref:hypothetical protein n=1 Tax=Rugamonas sp. TaxID=1926287 RepID=UPI0025DF74E1